MCNLRRFILISTITLISASSFAAPTNESQQIYEAYISNNMPAWKTIMDRMDKAKSPSNENLLQLLDFQYGYIAYCLGIDADDEAEYYLEKAWETADKLEERKYKLASVHAYKAALYGYEIGLGPYMAPFYGPRSIAAAEKAQELDSNDPLGYIQAGNMLFYMPAAFGGSKPEAIEYYRKAINMLEIQGKSKLNWQYLSLLATLGQAFEKTGQYKEAVAVYEKALREEPQFLFVRNKLLPAARKLLF